MKWYLVWFFFVQTSNGEINRSYTQSTPMTTRTECMIEAKEKEIALEYKLNKPHVVGAGWRMIAYGNIVGYSVGCKSGKY